MADVGELVRSTTGPMDGQATAALPATRFAPGHVLVGCVACSRGRHLTWRCECGAVSYGLALAEGCSLLRGPARVRVWTSAALQRNDFVEDGRLR
jgi:hypothetical protein